MKPHSCYDRAEGNLKNACINMKKDNFDKQEICFWNEIEY